MLQRLYAQLPDFARPDNPVMRYVMLQGDRRPSRRTRLLRAGAGFLALIVLILFGWQLATNFGATPMTAPNLWDQAFAVLYWPLVIIQVITGVFAIGSTTGVVANEVQQGTWDTLKVTTDGATMSLKSRWAAVFYRLRVLLFLLLAARIFFILVALHDLTAFQGNYLNILLSGTTPLGLPQVSTEASVLAGILITAMMMTACLLAPFTAVALDAAIGMWARTYSRGRFAASFGQLGMLVRLVHISGLALQVGAAALTLASLAPSLSLTLDNHPVLAWFAALFGISEGDMGLSLLNLQKVQALWANRQYGVLVGIAFLGYTLVQAALANQIVKWAGRRAARADSL